MASSEVNPQISDAVTQVDVASVAQGPGVALSLTYVSAAQALGLAYLSAGSAQQQAFQAAQAATGVTIAKILQST